MIKLIRKRYSMSRFYEYFLEKKEAELNSGSLEGELINHFDLSPQTDTGSDGFQYQNYIEYPDFSSYDDDDINFIMDLINLEFDIKDFDFEEKKEMTSNLSQYIDSLPEEIQNTFTYDADEKKELCIFPSEEELRDAIKDIFINNNVPFGALYEPDSPNFPEHYRLFQYEENPYEYDQLYDLDIIDSENTNRVDIYVDKLESIIKSYKSSQNPLIKKSLLLAAFSTNESFLRARIISKMPDINRITEDVYITMLIKKEIQKKLENYEERKNLFNKYYEQDHITFLDTDKDLRNSLAHNIDAPKVSGDNLTYLVYLKRRATTEERTVNMLTVLKDLKDHPTKLYPGNNNLKG